MRNSTDGKPETTDILERIADLHKQATTEYSHYYTASTLEACEREIIRLREHGKAMRDVVAAIAAQQGSADTIRAACRLLVRAYDEGMSEL